MKADPPLPTVSADTVAALGAERVARALLPGRLTGFAPVKVALRVESGESRGVCASAELAQRIVEFFA